MLSVVCLEKSHECSSPSNRELVDSISIGSLCPYGFVVFLVSCKKLRKKSWRRTFLEIYYKEVNIFFYDKGLGEHGLTENSIP